MISDRKFIYYFLLIITTLVATFFVKSYVFAFVSSSASYRLQSDSINVGGIPVSSASYKMENTVGEVGTGVVTSASYKVKGGYQQMVC